jgi:hypothetical protein
MKAAKLVVILVLVGVLAAAVLQGPLPSHFTYDSGKTVNPVEAPITIIHENIVSHHFRNMNGSHRAFPGVLTPWPDACRVHCLFHIHTSLAAVRSLSSPSPVFTTPLGSIINTAVNL